MKKYYSGSWKHTTWQLMDGMVQIMFSLVSINLQFLLPVSQLGNNQILIMKQSTNIAGNQTWDSYPFCAIPSFTHPAHYTHPWIVLVNSKGREGAIYKCPYSHPLTYWADSQVQCRYYAKQQWTLLPQKMKWTLAIPLSLLLQVKQKHNAICKWHRMWHSPQSPVFHNNRTKSAAW